MLIGILTLYTRALWRLKKRSIEILLVAVVSTLALARVGTSAKQRLSPLENAVLGSMYEQLPNIASCFSGKLREQEIRTALNTINQIRKLHHLQPVQRKNKWDKASAKAALIIAANKNMTHYPSPKSLCYSKEGAAISSHSNLSMYTYSVWDPTRKGRRVPDIKTMIKKNLVSTPDIINDWIIDRKILNLGHRRWLLNPFLTEISFGRVDAIVHSGDRWDVITGAALSYRATKALQPLPENFFVACPFNEYPAALFDKNEFLSFSAVPLSADIFGNKFVNMEKVKITLQNQQGKSLPVTDIHRDNHAYGVPNVLIWKTPGIQPGIRYTVIISNVRFGDGSRTYRYWFRILPE